MQSEEKMVEPAAAATEPTETEPTLSDPSALMTDIYDDDSPPESTIAERREVAAIPLPIRTSMEDQASLRMKERADAANPDEATPMSPDKSPKSGNVKNWLKSKFSKRNSKMVEKSEKTSPQGSPESIKAESFVGGAALTGAATNDSTISLGEKSTSIKDVALAGKEKEVEKEVLTPAAPPVGVESTYAGESSTAAEAARPISRASTVSAMESDEDEFQEAKDHFDSELTPPQPKFVADKSHSPARDSKFIEIIE